MSSYSTEREEDSRVIKLRHQQPTVWESLFAEEVAELWEPWMRVVDQLLEDEELVDAVYEAQGKRHPQSRLRGRQQTPAEVVLRMLILKHVRNWSYETLEREVRANVVYRSFCRIGMEKVPDAKTLVRLGQAIGPETVRELHDRIVALAQGRGVIQGRKMRVDTTVVESNIHYPTDSGLLNDGTRVLTRTMKKIEQKAGGLKRKIRNRMRSVTKKVIAIGLALRHKGTEGELKRKREYRQLLRLTRQILNDSRSRLTSLSGNRVRPANTRCLGLLHHPAHLIGHSFHPLAQSAHSPSAPWWQSFDFLPHLLLPAVEVHRRKLGRVPGWVAADAGFYSRANEEGAQALGVKYVSIPNRNTRSEERRRWEKQRWFKKGQKWRTGCEGRISVIKRRHGLARCRYHGLHGMRRWVGLGVIADNLINLGRYLAPQPA